MSGPPLRVQLRASPVLTLLTLAAHGAAAGVLVAVLPFPEAAGCAVLLGLLAVVVVRERTLFVSSTAPCAMELGRGASLLVRLRGGGEIAGHASPRRYVSRWLVVLHLTQPGRGRRTILVARDMLPAGKFRHIRLWALWDAVPAGAAGEGA